MSFSRSKRSPRLPHHGTGVALSPEVSGGLSAGGKKYIKILTVMSRKGKESGSQNNNSEGFK
jgi:hypothetical protein